MKVTISILCFNPINLVNHGLDFAKLSTEFRRTFAGIFIYSVDAHSTVLKVKLWINQKSYSQVKTLFYLAHVICTVVYVFGAVFASKSCDALAGVVGIVVDALTPIDARVELGRTKLDFGLAKLAKEAPRKFYYHFYLEKQES